MWLTAGQLNKFVKIPILTVAVAMLLFYTAAVKIGSYK